MLLEGFTIDKKTLQNDARLLKKAGNLKFANKVTQQANALDPAIKGLQQARHALIQKIYINNPSVNALDPAKMISNKEVKIYPDLLKPFKLEIPWSAGR